MDEATIGARLRILRRWRGMTQVELAGLADISPAFVSMVETGQRPLDRRSHIAAIASALRVSETDLVGGPHLSADRQQADPHMTIPALREALQTNKLTGPASKWRHRTGYGPDDRPGKDRLPHAPGEFPRRCRPWPRSGTQNA